MPTIIDQFVITLGLDPKGFTEGQRQLAANLRQLETGAQRAASNIERSGSGIVSFFRTIDHPIASIRQHFERLATVTATPQRNLANLAQQGLRTGLEVERGALAGAAGLRVMGAAGLTAIAAFMVLDKIRSSATDTARNLFGVGVGAAGAGIPIQQYTAISQALLHQGNVPEAESGGWLSQIRSAQVQAQHGDASQASALAVNLANAQVSGVNAYTDSPEKILAAVADRFHSVSADVAIGLGAMVGQSNVLALALHNLGGAGLEEQVQLERQRSATDAQSQSARDLTLAQSNLDISWQNLSRRIGQEVDPALARFDDLVAHVLDRLSGKDASHIARTAALSVVPGGAAVASGWNLWDSVKGWFGGGSSSAAPAGSAGGSSADPGDLGLAEQAIEQVESAGGKNYNNAPYPGHSATGPRQIIPSTFAENALPGERIDNPDDNRRVSNRLIKKLWDQYHNWDAVAYAYANGSPSSPDRNPGYVAQFNAALTKLKARGVLGSSPAETAGTSRGIFPYWVKFNSQGQPYELNMTAQEKANQDRAYAFIKAHPTSWLNPTSVQAAQAAQAGATTNHTTTNDVDINGGVHVYGTNTSGGYQTGGAIADALHSQLLTAQINSGQE